MSVVCFTLGFNLPSEIELTTQSLYALNKGTDFKHYIVDLGYPLEFGNDVPEDIEHSKLFNSILLKETCRIHGSTYVQLPNIGVSQNWTSFMKHIKLQDDDILICVEPDERPNKKAWVKAIVDIMKSNNKIAWCTLMIPEHRELLNNMPHETISVKGVDAYLLPVAHGIAMGGVNGAFLNAMGGMPVPDGAPVYGWMEHECYKWMRKLGYKIAVLKDFEVTHIESSILYRQWKTEVTSNVKQGQPAFETWLKNKKND